MAKYDRRGSPGNERKDGIEMTLRGGDRVITIQRVTLRLSTGDTVSFSCDVCVESLGMSVTETGIPVSAAFPGDAFEFCWMC